MSKLTNLSYVREVMNEFGINTKKKYGQNFLINEAVPSRIAEEGILFPDCGVLEIGPGIGTLTYELCRKAKKVLCLEIDETLPPVLEKTLSEFDNVKIILKDVLKTNLQQLISTEFPDFENIVVCANLPYYITTPVLMYLLESHVPFKSITVMVQKEVAERITAKAGSKEYGAITAAVAYYGTAKRLFNVSSGSFLPKPSVDSCVIRIDMHKENPYADCNSDFLFSMLKSAFNMRRKTLTNALKSLVSKEDLEEALLYMGFPRDVRGEKLSIDDFANIERFLKQKNR